MIGEANPVTVSFETPPERGTTVSGSQAANALLDNAERRKIDFIVLVSSKMLIFEICEQYEFVRFMNGPRR